MVNSDPACESLSDSEMRCFPCHLLIGTNHAFGDTRNRNFPRVCRGPHVQIDVASKIEATVDGRSYPCFELNDRQASIFLELRLLFHNSPGPLLLP